MDTNHNNSKERLSQHKGLNRETQMAFIERGTVQGGSILLSKPLALSEGTEVVIHIEPINSARQRPTGDEDENFADLPFFGMWAERGDMPDSTLWVRKERQTWHRRVIPQEKSTSK